MSRQIIQLHTIDQWMRLDPSIRVVVQKNLKLKDRLYKWLYNKALKSHEWFDPKYVRCSKCAHSEHPGWFLLEPRYEGIHPSALGDECFLKIYNEMIGSDGQGKAEARQQLIWDVGTAIHEMFQKYGLNGAWGPGYHHEVEISAQKQQLAGALMLEGHADAEQIFILDDIPDAPIFEVGLVHEYKSAKAEVFNKLASPKPAHKMQALTYSAVLNRPITVYFYLNKNDQNVLDFPVAFDPALWADYQNKILYLKQHYDAKTPPPGKVGYYCRECAYALTCPAYRAAQPARPA